LASRVCRRILLNEITHAGSGLLIIGPYCSSIADATLCRSYMGRMGPRHVKYVSRQASSSSRGGNEGSTPSDSGIDKNGFSLLSVSNNSLASLSRDCNEQIWSGLKSGDAGLYLLPGFRNSNNDLSLSHAACASVYRDAIGADPGKAWSLHCSGRVPEEASMKGFPSIF
jgi:hypothetical protein